jgi:hypothetical protein
VADEAGAVVGAEAAAAGEKRSGQPDSEEIDMRFTRSRHTALQGLFLLCGCLSMAVIAAGQQNASQTPRRAVTPRPTAQASAIRTFDNPQQAARALIDAADRFDVRELEHLFGASNKSVALSGEPAQDRKRVKDFVAAARENERVSVDRTGSRAYLLIGNENWPFPIPIVKRGVKWSFDAKAGRQELLYRRIGANELDAIAICRGYVDAQHEYALKKRDGYDVNQYAQQIISTPGKQDGLAWQTSEGTWDGPIGEATARAIEQGYTKGDPYHGYFFKVLKGQGPAAPLGQLDFVVNGAMIGGFALVAAPATYGVTGVKTFLVSHDGVVYERDFGQATREEFKKIERFNPDASWRPVTEE